ncbi:MAG TPA: ATP-binding protein [Solirubrobacterales bacterium]|nr:ATP-binding protein [Solirubrobacterales bacterium]
MQAPSRSQIKLSFPSEPASVTELRHRAAAFAAEQGADDRLVADVNLAVSEAVTNAVKYASKDDEAGTLEFVASAVGRWLELRLTDKGESFGKGSPDGLGLGLTIIARLCDDLKIVQEGKGTSVLMRFALQRD